MSQRLQALPITLHVSLLQAQGYKGIDFLSLTEQIEAQKKAIHKKTSDACEVRHTKATREINNQKAQLGAAHKTALANNTEIKELKITLQRLSKRHNRLAKRYKYFILHQACFRIFLRHWLWPTVA